MKMKSGKERDEIDDNGKRKQKGEGHIKKGKGRERR